MEDITHRETGLEQKSVEAKQEVIANPLTNHETNNDLRTALPQVLAAIIVNSFHVMAGIGYAFSAILIPQIEAPDSDLKLTEAETSWIASIIGLFNPLGNLLAAFLMDWIGRLNTIKLAAIPCCLGWILIANGTHFYMLLAGRILIGLALPIGNSPATVYITEVARSDIRGSLISTNQTLVSLGLVIAYAEGAFMSWRIVSWLNIIYTLVPVLLIQFFVPESPVWLAGKRRFADAAKSLKYLHKAYPQPDGTTQSVADIKIASLQRDQEMNLVSKIKVASQLDFVPTLKESIKNSKWTGFFKPTGYKPMHVLFWLFLIQQFSGIYITLFHAVSFIQEVQTGINAFTVSIFMGVMRFVMSFLNAWLMKRFKRRSLIMASTSGMSACMFVSGLTTYWIKQGQTGIEWVPVVCLFLYVYSSMIGFQSIPWTMTAELFPTDIRSIGNSLSCSMAHILMFVAIQSYRSLSNFLGGAAIQLFFAVVSICGFVFALVFLPETHCKDLIEIEAYFNGEANKQKKLNEKLCEESFKYHRNEL